MQKAPRSQPSFISRVGWLVGSSASCSVLLDWWAVRPDKINIIIFCNKKLWFGINFGGKQTRHMRGCVHLSMAEKMYGLLNRVYPTRYDDALQPSFNWLVSGRLRILLRHLTPYHFFPKWVIFRIRYFVNDDLNSCGQFTLGIGQIRDLGGVQVWSYLNGVRLAMFQSSRFDYYLTEY